MKTAKEFIEAMDDFFSNTDIPPIEKVILWDILTVLRGPDNFPNCVKLRTTACIRAMTFPKTYQFNINNGINLLRADMNAPQAFKYDFNYNPGTWITPYHFQDHIQYAISALQQIQKLPI